MIVFCGYANSDLTVRIPVLPGPGDRVHARAMVRHAGGMGANAAVAAARMGTRVGFAGVVGNDPLSTEFLDALSAEGIDVSYSTRDGELTTAIVLVTGDGQRSIISQDDALTAARVSEVVGTVHDAGGGWLYLDGYRFPSAARALENAPTVRPVVDLDGCEDAEAARSAMSVAEHVIAGRDHAEQLLDRDPGAAATDHGTHVLLTDGAKGWWLHTPTGQTHTGPAIDVAARDTTGAGDCFVGSYLAELASGVEPQAAARTAAVAAGLSCTTHGAREGIPHRAQVAAYLADNAAPTANEPPGGH